MNILLDCDGVLADFVSGALTAHGRESDGHDSVTHWNFFESWGLTEKEFWTPLRGRQFWFNLKPYPWAKQLISTIGKDNFTISTSPSADPECVAAKIDWLHAHFGIRMKDVMVGSKKWLMANPDTLLIDDSLENVKKFHEYGGKTILFPQPWNKGSGDCGTVIEQLKVML